MRLLVEIGIMVLAGALSIEIYDWSGRVAEKTIPFAARMWTTDQNRREICSEAWLAVANDCPGKLWRLVIAAGFLGGGFGRWSARCGVRAIRRVRRADRVALSSHAIASMIAHETPGQDEFAGFFLKAYGVRVRRVGPGTNGEEIYQSNAGDLITTVWQGACGTSYWQVIRQAPGQEPVELIRLGRLNENGELRSVLVNPWGS